MNIDLSALGPLAGSLLRAGLPSLGTLLGAVVPPPFDLMVKPAFAAIAWAMGVDPEAPTAAADVQAKVDADPVAAATKLQAVEDAHKEAADAAQAELEARLKDVQDARATQVQLTKSGSPLQWAMPILGTFVTVGFIAATLSVAFHAVDQSPMAIYLITTLGGGFTMVLNYVFGSSAGSKEKSDALAALAAQPQVNMGPGSHVSGGVSPNKRLTK